MHETKGVVVPKVQTADNCFGLIGPRQCRWTSHLKTVDLRHHGAYVDDILLEVRSQKKIDQVEVDLGKQFYLNYMHYFLGVRVKQNSETGKTWIGQQAYTEAVIKKFGMEHCKPANTPLTPGTKQLKATGQSEMADATLYRRDRFNMSRQI